MEPFRREPGDALVNLGDLFPSLDKLRSSFDPLDLIDLCVALETAVLTERMVALGPTRAAGSEPLLRPLEQAGIVIRVPLVVDGAGDGGTDLVSAAATITDQPIARELMAITPKFFEPKDADLFSDVFAWTIGMVVDVVYERRLGIPLALSAHFLPLYYSIPTIRADIQRYERARGLIWVVNRLVSAELTGRRRAHREGRNPFDSRPGGDVYQLPPIAVEVLTQAERVDGIGRVVLDVRDRYRNLRRKLAEHDALLLDPSVAPAEKELESARIIGSINRWSARRQRHHARRLNRLDSPALGPFLDALDITHAIGDPTGLSGSVSLVRLARALLTAFGERVSDKIDNAWRHLRGGLALGAFDVSAYRYLDTPSTEIARAVQRLFGHEIGAEDTAKADRYAAYVRSLRARALGHAGPQS